MTDGGHWLTILGIGEDGVEGLSDVARRALGEAAAVFGGARHIALAAPLLHGEAISWPARLKTAIPAILARRGEKIVVLASGDPFCFGIGSLLAECVPLDEMRCLPAPSAFSLACARLGWALQKTALLSFCGRPLDALPPFLQPNARILALSADATTPGAIAALLTRCGFGKTRLVVLEALGGKDERIRDTAAETFAWNDINPLNLTALEIIPNPDAAIIPRTPGRAESFFEHDGQITKHEIRAIALAALAPKRGELLWDIGAGSGAISIEWMLADPANHAIAIESHPERAARIARNAQALGVPTLEIRNGRAPEALTRLPAPNAVFIGGGARQPEVIETAWNALPAGGRLLAHGVTLESETALAHAYQRLGGQMTRIHIERLEPLGSLHGFRPAMPVTQFLAHKP